MNRRKFLAGSVVSVLAVVGLDTSRGENVSEKETLGGETARRSRCDPWCNNE